MNTADLKLVEPDLSLQDAFYRYCEAYRQANEPPRHYEDLAYQDFPAFIKKLRDSALGIGVPDGFVPSTVYWLVCAGQVILGSSSLRHHLSPSLEKIGGHIGYSIHPFERKKGYGTILLRLTLEKAREKGLTRVLVTCDADNLGSAGVIQNNGGVLASQDPAGQTGKLISRYWIHL